MNRPIKFRAWDGEAMQEVISLAWTKHFGIKVNFDSAWDNPMAKEWPLMQFTGLLDKNGKEIYEGDIVFASIWSFGDEKRRPFTVEWEEASAGFDLRRLADIEIIGNIYENPELLNV